jgi:hypothetical protein
MNQHAYTYMSQPLQYPVADLALKADATVAEPGSANPDVAAGHAGGAGGKRKVFIGKKVAHHGKEYAVRQGPKGGHYILVKGEKHYVKA